MNDDQPVRAMLVPLTTADASSGVRLSDLAAALHRLRLVVSGIALVCLLATVAIYFLADTKYRATTTFILAEQAQGLSSLGALGSQLGGIANLAGIALPTSNGIREEVFATLESRQLLRDFISDRNLIPILYADKWNDKESSWETETGEAPSIEKAITFFQEKVLTIRREPNRNIVELSVDWTDRALCREWANELLRRVNEGLRLRTKSEAARSIEFLEEELQASSNAELQSAIFALIEQQMAKTMMANVQTDFAFRVIDPATTPDPDDRVSPRLLLFLIAGGVAWVLIGGMLVVVGAFRNRGDDQPE